MIENSKDFAMIQQKLVQTKHLSVDSLMCKAQRNVNDFTSDCMQKGHTHKGKIVFMATTTNLVHHTALFNSKTTIVSAFI